MARTSDYSSFRARAVRLPWEEMARAQRKLASAAARDEGTRPDRRSPLWDEELLARRSQDIHLTWACAATLGVPRRPFQVWVRAPKDSPQSVDASVEGGADARVLWPGGEAACLRVTCRPVDPSQPVAVFAMRTVEGTDAVVSAAAEMPGGPGDLTVTVRTPGSTWARVLNGTDIRLAVQSLEDVVADPSWRLIELVGLPVDAGNAGFDYDAVDQGPVSAPLPPVEAALHRLRRGGPPIGWGPVTETGRAAPPWQAPDPERLVEEVRGELLPELPPMYDRAVPEHRQWEVRAPRPVDPPQQDGRMSSLDAQVDTGPWPMLLLPALSDPFLNLACGFGASYSVEPLSDEQVEVGHCDFLVTAEYDELAYPHQGGGEMAAYAPAPERHLRVPDPVPLVAERDGLVGPVAPDEPWRESIRLRWARVRPAAGMSPITEAALARYDLSGSGPATSLLPERDAGGDRPLLVVPDGPEGEPGYDEVALVDGGRDIPLGSGGRQVGYATAVSDVHGVWSGWQDVPWTGSEPLAQPPRIVSLALDTSYAGSDVCPATLKAEIAVEWIERRPAAVEVVAVFFPMATPSTGPPAGIAPDDPAPPPGCFRRELGLTFSGDVPTASGCTVTPLSADGTEAVAPGAAQGDGGRRYALAAAVPTLAFGGTPRWGVQVWTRRTLRVGPSPTPWAPAPAHPATTSAASPVPVEPLPAPWPTGVPLGSTPDPQGCSHARVAWSLPTSSGVRTTIVWEVSETALRQRAGLTARAGEHLTPGQRLDALRAAYDGLAPATRRAAFRRLQELEGSPGVTDVTLPKGSTDIHLFAVTTMTTSGIEGSWPAGAKPHEHLRAVIAPRLQAPAPPVARAELALDGTVTLRLAVASAVPVRQLRLYRTTSTDAAREIGSMGPPFAQVDVAPDPVPVEVDPVLRLPVWQVTWTGTLPARWTPWLLRAVAVPVETVPPRGVRGVLSPPSDVVSLLVPPDSAPVLEPLVAEVWGSDHRGVVVRTATTAPPRPLPLGEHRLDGTAGSQLLAPVALHEAPVTALTAPPAAAASGVVLEQGTRSSSGISPLALWFTRPVAADPVTVTLSLVDPFGRRTTREVEVPGWAPPVTGLHLSIVGLRVVPGRGVAFGIETDAPADVRPPYVLEVVALRKLGPVFPPGPRPGPGSGPLPIRTPRMLKRSLPLPDIPTLVRGPGRSSRIEVWRTVRRLVEGPTYQAFVPLASPLSVTVAVVAADGARVEAAGSL